MEIKQIKIKDIIPASYNPRKIEKEQLDNLTNSIKKIGFVIPIIVNADNNTIIAGHQRTKAASSIGIKQVPAYLVKNITLNDEIRFNQHHNGVESNVSGIFNIDTKKMNKEQFIQIDADKYIQKKDVKMLLCNNTYDLITKYGNVFTAVICKNDIFLGNEYIKACKLLDIKVNSYICDDNKYDIVKDYFSQSYGKYTYENLKKNTYIQGLAQLSRLLQKKRKWQ